MPYRPSINIDLRRYEKNRGILTCDGGGTSNVYLVDKPFISDFFVECFSQFDERVAAIDRLQDGQEAPAALARVGDNIRRHDIRRLDINNTE